MKYNLPNIIFWLNTSTFHIKHGAYYALLLCRLEGKGNFIHLPKRYWANSFGPGRKNTGGKTEEGQPVPRTVALHRSLANSWILICTARYAPRTWSMKQSYVRHIHLKQWSRTVYWKRSSQQIQVILFSCSNILLFYALPLYIFSLFSTYIVLILKRGGEIHFRFQVFQCKTEIISHLQKITLSITVPTP